MADFDIVQALEAGRKAHNESVRNAYLLARQPTLDAQSDAAAEQGLANEKQTFDIRKQQAEDTAEDRERAAQERAYAMGSKVIGYIAQQKDQNPNLKASDALKTIPPQHLATAGLDTPEAQQAFAAQHDGQTAAQMKAEADFFGGDDPVTGHVAIQGPDGKKGIAYIRKSGRVDNNYAAAPAPKEATPKTPEEVAALKALTDQREAAARLSDRKPGTPAPKAGATTPEAANAAADDLVETMGQYKATLADLAKAGGTVRPGGNIVSNAMNVIAGTDAGKVAGSVMGDKNTALRQRLDEIGPTILHTYAQALGLKSAQLNTEKEYQRFKAVLGNPNAPVEVRQAAIDDLIRHVQNAKAARTAAAPAAGGAKKVLKYNAETGELE